VALFERTLADQIEDETFETLRQGAIYNGQKAFDVLNLTLAGPSGCVVSGKVTLLTNLAAVKVTFPITIQIGDCIGPHCTKGHKVEDKRYTLAEDEGGIVVESAPISKRFLFNVHCI
jgi:hypothetical protein